jgi:hypothetical protein
MPLRSRKRSRSVAKGRAEHASVLSLDAIQRECELQRWVNGVSLLGISRKIKFGITKDEKVVQQVMMFANISQPERPLAYLMAALNPTIAAEFNRWLDSLRNAPSHLDFSLVSDSETGLVLVETHSVPSSCWTVVLEDVADANRLVIVGKSPFYVDSVVRTSVGETIVTVRSSPTPSPSDVLVAPLRSASSLAQCCRRSIQK